VVLAGEPGAEKERCARLLHAWRARPGAFHRIGCAGRFGPELASSLPRHVLEGGTLFLEDADDLSPGDVAELRECLEGRADGGREDSGRGGPYRARVGELHEGSPDVDMVVALKDHRRPAAALAMPGHAHIPVIPPLRERKEALRAHIRHILHDLGRPEVTVSVGFMLGLVHHDFPDDVRELAMIVSHALPRSRDELLDSDHLPSPLRSRLAGLYQP
jgi:DNA-binding NtrC family response regulator